jgi:hypothetical protein
MASELLFRSGAERYTPGQILQATQELERWNRERLDIVVPTKAVRISEKGDMYLECSTKLMRVKNRLFADFHLAEKYMETLREVDADTDAKIEVTSPDLRIPLTQRAKTQLFSRVNVPIRYVNKQTADGNGGVMWKHLQDLLDKSDKKVMLRTLDGHVRSVLSSSYKIIDSYDVMTKTVDLLGKHGADIMEVKVFDDNFQITACKADMVQRLDEFFDKNDQGPHTWFREGGDPQFPLLSISNNENGSGGLHVKFGFFAQVCKNTATLSKSVVELRHIGADLATRVAESLVLSASTRNLIAAADMSKIGDAIAACFNQEKFRELVRVMAKAKLDVIEAEKVEAACKAVIVSGGLPRDTLTLMMEKVMEGRDLSRYGIAQATTALAHKASDALAFKLEAAGGELLGEFSNGEKQINFDSWINVNSRKFDKAVEAEDEELVLV